MGRMQDLFKANFDKDSVQLPYGEMVDTLMNGISDFIFLMAVEEDLSFTYVYLNRSAEKYHLLPKSKWEGKRMEDILEKEKAEHLAEEYQKVVNTGSPHTYEDQMIVNGFTFNGHTLLTPLKNEDHQVTHILAITRDITDLVEKEKQLKRINAEYHSLMKHTADAILIVDMEGKVQEFNPAFQKLYGFERSELQDTHFPFIPEELQPEAHGLLRKAVDGNYTSSFETVRRRKDGTKVEVEITVSPIHGEEDKVIAVSSIIRDISEQKQIARKLEGSRHRYHSLFQYNPHPVLRLSSAGDILKANPASLTMLNTSQERLWHTSILQWIPEDKLEEVRSHINGFLEEQTSFQTCFKVAGEERIVNVFLVPILDHQQKVGMYAVLEDVTEKKYALDRLKQSEEKFQLIANHSQDLITVFSPKGNIMYASPSHQQLMGIDPLSMDFDKVVKFLHPEDLPEVIGLFKQFNNSSHSFTMKVRLLNDQGQWIWHDCRGNPVLSEDGKVSHIVLVARDITRQVSYEKQLKEFAYYDYLTDLPNRRFFEDQMENLIENSKHNHTIMALLYLDGDSFKQINDQYGHDKGDEFLRAVGERLSKWIREGDLVARIGGDEFAVLLNNLSRKEQAVEISQRLLDRLRIPYQVGSLSILSSFSIGVASFPSDSETMEGLFRLADQALYAGKKKGKDQIYLYDDLV